MNVIYYETVCAQFENENKLLRNFFISLGITKKSVICRLISEPLRSPHHPIDLPDSFQTDLLGHSEGSIVVGHDVAERNKVEVTFYVICQ